MNGIRQTMHAEVSVYDKLHANYLNSSVHNIFADTRQEQFSNFFQLFLPSVLYTGIFYHHTGIQPGTIKNRKQVVYHKFGLDGMHSETSSSPH